MTTQKSIDVAAAHQMFAAVAGEYCWFVRLSEDRVLRMEFGDPYLDVQGPRLDGPPLTETVGRVLRRRIVTPTGTSSLFVEHGLWQVESHGLRCRRSDEDSDGAERALSCLSGQRLSEVRIEVSDNILVLHFDLGGRLEIDHDHSSEGGSQWILFFKHSQVLAHDTAEGLVVEGQVVVRS